MFHYIYAVFHAPTFRSRYAEFLKTSFPRVPLTSDLDLFQSLCGLGAELVRWHLLEDIADSEIKAGYPEPGSDLVKKGHPRHRAGKGKDKGRIMINEIQYFDGVSPRVWEFRIGGYQVAEKWLKDRQGRNLTYPEIEHFRKTLTALARTGKLMEELDRLIPGWPLP